MAPIKDKIPAYSTWEIFYHTIQLLEQEPCETMISKLTEIVNSENLTNIFVYTSTSDESYKHQEEMSQQYKSFTIWLMGKFFYLLSCESLIGVHAKLIDAQLKILHLIKITEPCSYNHLSLEYSNLLKKLNNYNSNKTLNIEIFNPNLTSEEMVLNGVTIEINSQTKCECLKEQVLIFLNDTLIRKISYSIDTNLYKDLDLLIHILKEDKVSLKISVFEVIKNIFKVDIIRVNAFPNELKDKFRLIFELLEQFCNNIFSSKTKLKDDEFNKFKTILFYLLNQNNYVHHKINISKLIINQLKSGEFSNTFSDDFVRICYKLIENTSIEDNFDFNQINIDSVCNLEQSRIKLKDDLFKCLNKLNNTNLCVEDISETWKTILRGLNLKLEPINCVNKNCVLKKTLKFIHQLCEIALKLRYESVIFFNVKKVAKINIEFFNNQFFLSVISFINQHIKNCVVQLPVKEFIGIVTLFPAIASNENVHIYFHIIAYQYLTLFYKTSNDLPYNFSGNIDKSQGNINLKLLYNNLAYYQETKDETVSNLINFIRILSSDLINDLDDISKHNVQVNCLKIITEIYTKGSLIQQSLLYNNINDIILFTKSYQFIPKILTRLTTIPSNSREFLSSLICFCYGKVIKITSIKEKETFITTQYICLDCNDNNYKQDDNNYNNSKVMEDIKKSKYKNESFLISFDNKLKIETNVNQEIVQVLMKKISLKSNDLKLSFLVSLPSLHRHLQEFNEKKYVEIWIENVKYKDDLILKIYPLSVYGALKAIQESKLTPKETKSEIITFVIDELYKYMLASMPNDKNYMQNPILTTIYKLIDLKIKPITSKMIKILLYYIAIPLSCYPEIAQCYFLDLAESQQTKPRLLYGKFRREICEMIADLCAINQQLAIYTIMESLENVPMVLGYSSTKDFLRTESTYLIPFFVSLIVLMPGVKTLIHEISTLINTDLNELLANNYGGIFLQIFLNKDEDTFKQCMRYVEQTTRLSGPILRKRNFRTILNELLLNFYDKKERVLHALLLLMKEDTDGQKLTISQIPDYLQPRFLGVLQYFDTKLFSNKQVLLSLPKIFELMGPKRIVPFRLKIIAMLRTALSLNYGDYPALSCNVWDSFIRSCEVESLGTQLATIFVSLIPLNDTYPKINEIFRYLIIENEELLKGYISDLFFALDYDIDEEIKFVIKKYSKILESNDFEDQMKVFMKYLTHETDEVKVHALKYLKKIIEENRQKLDNMILGYNGIKPHIVELLDALMSLSREKEVSVKLACSECIGELGAIEPSHLPRKYTQAESFIFYITEDAFIFNSLNELIRTLQSEKNTTVMDRFALAIQEILKICEISPNPSSSKHSLWNKFPASHQELIAPFLSSKYTMGQMSDPVNVSPIYGSKLGANLQSWIFNWSVSMIMTINPDKRPLLQVCLPSIKQDEKLQMHFLPHILLHSLLDGKQKIRKKWHEEFFAVINSMNEHKRISDDLSNLRPLRMSIESISKSSTVVSQKINQNRCIKVIFVLLDFLDRWIREFEWQNGASSRNDENYQCIKSWISGFCKLELARCSFQTGEYSRALIYLEDYISKNQDKFQHHYSFLSYIYAQLNEPDAVNGVAALRHTEPTLEERILDLEVSGKLSDAAACYERIPFPYKFYQLKGLTQCYLRLDNVTTALNFVKGAMESQPEYSYKFLELQAEPLWRLNRWDDLDELVKKPELEINESWGVNIGKVLLKMSKSDRGGFKEILSNLRLHQVDLLGATSLEEGAYQQGYTSIVNLHALNELEVMEKMIYSLLVKPNDHQFVERIVSKTSTDLELRLKVVQESIKIIEPILCLRRVALNQAKELIKEKIPKASMLIDGILGESWLRSARVARNAGIYQQAYTYLLKAEEFAPERLFIEKAELYWLKKEHEHALNTLRRGIDKMMPLNDDKNKLKICAEAKLLIAEYNDKISNVDREINISHYKEALELNKEREQSYVCLAQYYDKIYHSFSDEVKDDRASDIQIHMINCYSKSMLYGTNFIHQSMSRMLSIWFDYGTRLFDLKTIDLREDRKQNLLRMTKLIDTALERLPSYMFLTAFSQLISRICHPQREVYIELKSIIIKLILQYPQQTLWMMMPSIKSSDAARSKRCAEILGDSRLSNASIKKLITDFTKLAEKLIELCNKEIAENAKTASINVLLRSLPRLLAREDFSEIMIPTQKFRKLVLPNPDLNSHRHNPFPNYYAHIVGIEDEIVILNSMQRPRKIVFRGSDGKRYVQMLKPKDDLRKDFRFMEFNDIVNQLLSRDPESRHRRLNIRLYSVSPLNEECGLIEWIHDLVGLRVVLCAIYKQKGTYMTGYELKKTCCKISDPLAKKREVFLNKLLPNHPPVLGEWFRKTFPDVQNWLTSRTAYIRTTSVMSMIGYVLGLGDRHGENVLLDSSCGDVVHVDFNCLFNKGETLEWPERVPFRLTHNMVSAMGPLGIEGIFRKSCECTLKVLRENKETLMSIVTPFVYDPSVSWSSRNVPLAGTSEQTNKEAVRSVKNIELRLEGIVRGRGNTMSIPLSVEGQSNTIIQEAMNVDNLSQMYIGWGAYL
ncbi:serine/threonine-protein kinase ATR [Onthophagus taurus]|uniref:serine/threonine-protein kinase ATR n=1 Tax=Onthophagus taurus TaxID=166361 RepID=UPI0039BDBDBE